MFVIRERLYVHPVQQRQQKPVSAFSVAIIPDTQFGELNVDVTNRVNIASLCLCFVVSFCVATIVPKINQKSCDMFRIRYVNAYQTGLKTRPLYCEVPL